MALGEMHAGLSRTVDDFMFVKVGTGVGCGIVVDGAVYRGQSGSAGGIGHIRVADDGPVCVCGNVGCLEAMFIGAALARDARAAARSGRSDFLRERLEEAGDVTAAVKADPTTGEPCLGGVSLGRFKAAASSASLLPAM